MVVYYLVNIEPLYFVVRNELNINIRLICSTWQYDFCHWVKNMLYQR